MCNLNMDQDMKKVPYGCNNKTNLAYVKYVKYFLLRAFTENLKQLSSILTNVWRLEADYVIWFVRWRQEGR